MLAIIFRVAFGLIDGPLKQRKRIGRDNGGSRARIAIGEKSGLVIMRGQK